MMSSSCWGPATPEELVAALNPEGITVVEVGEWILAAKTEWEYVLGVSDDSP